MQENYRWGILAPGKIAHKFATGLKFVPGASLHAIGSRNLDRAKEFAAQYHAPNSYGSYEALASDPDVDVIYIATPHSFHMENTLLCLEQGKAVLCEKPLAINSRQVQAMIDASREHHTFLMEALWSRFLPNILKAKDLLDSGVIGQPEHLQVDFGFQAVYNPESRLFNPALGGGALLDIGIYPLFFAVYLFGMPSKVESKAELAPTGVDQNCQVNLTFTSGVTADLWFTLTENTPVEARIKGDLGEIILPNRWYQPVNVFANVGQEPEETVIDFVGNGYNYQALEVQKCLGEGAIESSIWSHQNSLKLMQLMDQIRQQIGLIYPEDGNNQ
jgi:predicted dehydrogenase